jgi:hypothetical protein
VQSAHELKELRRGKKQEKPTVVLREIGVFIGELLKWVVSSERR